MRGFLRRQFLRVFPLSALNQLVGGGLVVADILVNGDALNGFDGERAVLDGLFHSSGVDYVTVVERIKGGRDVVILLHLLNVGSALLLGLNVGFLLNRLHGLLQSLGVLLRCHAGCFCFVGRRGIVGSVFLCVYIFADSLDDIFFRKETGIYAGSVLGICVSGVFPVGFSRHPLVIGRPHSFV